ncbi:stalk domain-containing protein [Ammoniphilus sp. 3BR4]|uniref:stalk domain-containing protein n=1 Tax=Ammoniphilus sp. 3BR4 TaxID=3158265 RepID=UPI00346754A0
MEKLNMILLSLFVGLCIGAFPLISEEIAPAVGSAEILPSGGVEKVEAPPPDRSMKIQLDNRQVWVNEEWVPGEVFVLDGRTYIPTRALEALGAEIRYDSDGRQVEVRIK